MKRESERQLIITEIQYKVKTGYYMQNIKTFIRMYRQLVQILNSKQKRQAIVVALFAIISALLETLGVSVMIPFILMMLQPEQLMSNQYVKKMLGVLGITEVYQVLLVTALMIVAIYVLKNAFILWFNYVQLNFRNRLERDLSILMLRSYIYKPYSFFLNVNSAEIMRGITGDISGIATVVDCYCNLFNEGITCLLIGGVLVAMNPFLALCLLVLAGVTALTMVVGLRKKISECGVECRKAFAKRYQHAYQAINGIKEINVMKRQDNFLQYFDDASQVACRYNTRYLWVAKLPSRIIETIFISGLIVLVLISMKTVDNTVMLVAQFGTLAMASVRILPSISNIANAMNSLVYQRPALENAYNNIISQRSQIQQYEKSDMKGIESKADYNTVISVDHIQWRYEKNLPDVLKDLCLDIKPGEAIGLIGESGAGKTTLVDIILGLFEPQHGTIRVDNKNIFDINTGWHKLIGYVPQNVFLIDDTVRNNILFGIDETEIDEERVWRAIEQAQLKDFVEKLPQGLDTILGERGVKISGGQRQRIAIARALYYDPAVLVLDEATSALDNETESAIMEAINTLQGEKTLIIVAHRLTTIEKCDRIYEIKNGKAEIVNKQDIFKGI